MKSLSFSSLINLHSLIKQGMTLLIEKPKDKKKVEECFKLFLQRADQFNDPQAFWRVSACYARAIGTKEDKYKSFEYAFKAKEQGIIEGIFWFGVNCYQKFKDKEAYQCFHQLAQRGNLASIYWEGYLEYNGSGIDKNEENGRRKILHVLTNGDGYWTYAYSEFLQYDYFEFQKIIKFNKTNFNIFGQLKEL
jgi:hypothetical protein